MLDLGWSGGDRGGRYDQRGSKRRVAQVVQEEWREEMETKSCLRMYRRFKTEMREEDYGGGRESSYGLRP